MLQFKTALTIKAKILILVDWFYPGYKAGGPIQSCKNIVSLLKDDFELYILTSDRDIGDTTPYSGIKTNQWLTFDSNVKIFYADPSFLSIKNITQIIQKVQPDTVYLNSMFSPAFTIKPLLALKNNSKNSKIILAPRGMLHSGARKAKRLKKLLFLRGIKFTGLTGKVMFHATDQQEVEDIKKFFSKKNTISLVENIPNTNSGEINYQTKVKGEIKFVFLSRIHPKKNLLYFLKLLSAIKDVNILIDVYGYIDDKEYYQKCNTFINTYPPTIKVKFLGPIESNEVFETISRYHVFVLPTLGENFGHAIFEALSSARPVLISDQTPWRNLETGKAGWDINLNEQQYFIKTIKNIAAWDQEEFNEWCKGAHQYAQNKIKKSSVKEAYINLFS